MDRYILETEYCGDDFVAYLFEVCDDHVVLTKYICDDELPDSAIEWTERCSLKDARVFWKELVDDGYISIRD